MLGARGLQQGRARVQTARKQKAMQWSNYNASTIWQRKVCCDRLLLAHSANCIILNFVIVSQKCFRNAAMRPAPRLLRPERLARGRLPLCSP